MSKLRLPLLIIGLVLLAGLAAPTSFAAPDDTAALAKVDPHLLARTANGGRAPFLVVLRDQADLSPTARLATKQEKGRFVYNALRAAASRTQPAVRAALDRLGLVYRAYYIVNLFAVQNGSRSQIAQLAARRDVARIDDDATFHAALPIPNTLPLLTPTAPQTAEWNLTQIGAPSVWSMGFRGAGLVYAVADTGVYWRHPALINKYRGYVNGVADHNYNWWDAVHSDPSGTNLCGINLLHPCDDYGHGTHTTGIGVGNDNMGNQIGVAPAARWIACRNMNDGNGTPSRYIECFQFFLAPWDLQGKNPNPDRNADVISNSWTCPPSEGCAPNTLKATVEAVRSAGIMVVGSAGNDGLTAPCATITEPIATYDATTTIGATDSTDTLADFSSRGPVTKRDGSKIVKPDLVAPGVDIRSSYSGGGYVLMSGTSMAAPHVAGAVALLWQARPALRGRPRATEQALFNTASRTVTAAGTCGGTTSATIPNNLFGYGRLDIYAAIQSIAP